MDGHALGAYSQGVARVLDITSREGATLRFDDGADREIGIGTVGAVRRLAGATEDLMIADTYGAQSVISSRAVSAVITSATDRKTSSSAVKSLNDASGIQS